MKTRLWALLVATIAGATSLANAGDVRYKLNGIEYPAISVSDTAPYSNIDITLPAALTYTGFEDLHIYGVGGASVSVGTITIHGSYPASGTKALRVLVAGVDREPVENDFGFAGSPVPSPGFANFGGIAFSDAGLRDHAAVSVTVLGDISGDITAGNVFHVDAVRSLTEEVGGTISGNITSTRHDGSLIPASGTDLPNFGIGYVRAGWQITGNIMATHDATAATFDPADHTTWSSIGIA